MNCTLVKQLPNHCVPACLESVAKDSGITSITQENIVRQFPIVFPNGVLNDLNKSPNLESVVRDLGLADGICRIRFKGIENLAELHRENEILLMWEKVAKHCVRVCDCDPGSQSVAVMDPEQGDLQKYDAARLNSLAPSLVFFKRRRVTSSQHVYEVRPRKDHRGVDLLSDALPFGRVWYGEPDAINNAITYAKFFSRSHDAVIRVYDEAGNVLATPDHGGDFKETINELAILEPLGNTSLYGARNRLQVAV